MAKGKVPGITVKVMQGDKSSGKEVNTIIDNSSEQRKGSTEAELMKSMNQSGSTEAELMKSLDAAIAGGNKAS